MVLGLHQAASMHIFELLNYNHQAPDSNAIFADRSRSAMHHAGRFAEPIILAIVASITLQQIMLGNH